MGLNVAFPSVEPARVNWTPVTAQAVSRSPTSFRTQTYDWGGRAYKLTIEMQTMDRTDAALMAAFLRAVDGPAGTFTFDLTPWLLGVSPAPGTRVFRFVGDPAIQSHGRVAHNLTIEAFEEPA